MKVRIEILLENNTVLKHFFGIGNSEIFDFASDENSVTETSNKLITQQPKAIEHFNKTFIDNSSLTSLFDEFDNYVGLKNLKQSLKGFYYLSRFYQRKKKEWCRN